MGSPALYGTHVPLLTILAKYFSIASIIEFGCGNYSTRTFLNKKIFPDLKKIISLESNLKWYSRIKKDVKDSRFTIIHKDERRLLRISKRYAPSDLVFVDGKSTEMRKVTAIFAKNLSNLVVLHDAENKNYQDAIISYKFRYIYTKLLPHTAVLSDVIDVGLILAKE